jgi:retron-type reverse transcriptase
MQFILKNIYSNFKDIQAVGIDGTSKQKFDEILEEELNIIERKTENNSYDFSFYKQKLIVKSINKTREISIPTLRDKLVLKYLYNNIFEAFSSKLNESLTAQKTISEVKKYKDNFNSFIKIDIQNFFPSIKHQILLNKLISEIKDEKILNLIEKAISQTTVDINTSFKQRIKYNNKVGIPQGLSISGILAEIYIYDLVQKYNKSNLKFFRYVDDVLILCNREDIADTIKSLKNDFEELKLTIHDFEVNSNKSSYGNIQDTFEFLGYRFENELISVRDASVQKMYGNISKLFTQYKNKKFNSKKEFITRLNLKITGCVIDGKKYGWISYFSLINDFKLLFGLDVFVEKNCKKYNIEHGKIKKFTRAIHEIKNVDSNYLIYDLKVFRISKEELINDFYEDMDFYHH